MRYEYPEEDYFDSDDLDDLGDSDEIPRETPQEQFVSLLSQDTMPHLRQIAKRRGIKVVAKNKVELVEKLAPALSEPDGIDAALATLDAEAGSTLAIADIVGQLEPQTSHLFGPALQRLGKTTKPGSGDSSVLSPLLDRALLLLDQRIYGAARFLVPVVVSQRLSTRDDLLQPLRNWAPKKLPAAQGLGLVEIIQVIVSELEQGAIGHEPPPAASGPEGMPMGWQSATGKRQSPQHYWAPRRITLEAVPPPLAQPDMLRLLKLTGSSARMVEFALYLLLVYGIVEPPEADMSGWVVHRETLQQLLRMSGAQRNWSLLQGWLTGLLGSYELGPLVAKNGPFTLHYQSSGYPSPTDGPDVSLLRRLVTRTIGHIPHDGKNWYSVDALLELLRAIAPDLLTHHLWWLTTRDNRRLDLRKEDDWALLWEPLVTTMLSGPMTWLGLVDTALDGDRLAAFRPTPDADLLLDRLTNYMPSVDHYPISIDGALDEGQPVVTLTPGTPFWPAHSLLADIGELASVSRARLRYSITRHRLHDTFEDGITGPEVMERLENYSGQALPPAVKQAIERWWEGYGTVRAYDDVTVLELGDSLLSELSTIPSFKKAAIFTLSPHLIAVDPQRADELIAELTRLGYTPRVMDGV